MVVQTTIEDEENKLNKSVDLFKYHNGEWVHQLDQSDVIESIYAPFLFCTTGMSEENVENCRLFDSVIFRDETFPFHNRDSSLSYLLRSLFDGYTYYKQALYFSFNGSIYKGIPWEKYEIMKQFVSGVESGYNSTD